MQDWLNFPAIGLNTERYGVFGPNVGKCWKNADQNNSEYGHFLHSVDSHYKAWSYKKKKHKKIKAYIKSLYKEPTVNRYLLILDLKPFRF